MASLYDGARVTLHSLQGRSDLNGCTGSILSRIAASGRWQVRTSAGETVAIKPECLSSDMTVPPHCRTLWATTAPPSDPLQRVRALHVKLGEVAFEANQAFVDDGGVAAVVQIAFGAWPDGGVAASTHWADEVVQIAPGVHHSARRVALSALADMAPEGEPYVSALVSNVLFREAFAPAAASLLSRYHWRQPFASMCCPRNHDQGQYMAERLVNIANCTLSNWAATEQLDADAKISAAVAALVLPILHAIPHPLPALALNSSSERKRAANALRAARANELDRLLCRPTSLQEKEAMRQVALKQGMDPKVLAALDRGDIALAAPEEPLGCESDYMADGVGRMLNAVLNHALKRHSAKPLDAPWMGPVLAAGASAKLMDLLAPFVSKANLEPAKYAKDPAVRALGFFSAVAGTSTGASQPTSLPRKAADVPRVTPGSDANSSSFDARARIQGTCAQCEARVRTLKWCSGCHLVGYCGSECQRAAWKAHKKHCQLFTKWERFVAHVMAVQTEPFRAGLRAGQMPAHVYAQGGRPDIPVYSKRQMSLQEYVMMLSASERRFSSGTDRQAATDGVDGVSQHTAVTWVRAGVVAATYTHGPKLRLCDRPLCDHCIITWRQTLEARVCQVCEKPIMVFRGIGTPMGRSSTTPLWVRSVRPDPRTGEPRLHFAELETCSDACKREVLAGLARGANISRNDFIDSADALEKQSGADTAVEADFEQMSLTSIRRP